MQIHRHPFVAIVSLFAALGLSACVAATDEEIDESLLDDSEEIDADAEAYRVKVRVSNDGCSYLPSAERCGGGHCTYWYLDVNDSQSDCDGDRICVCSAE
jgi:hypothetical protein